VPLRPHGFSREGSDLHLHLLYTHSSSFFMFDSMRRSLYFALAVVGCLLVSATPVCKATPIFERSANTVWTLLAGPITGIQVSSTSFKFLGIPYAQAPTGVRRFASPVPYPPAGFFQPYYPKHRMTDKSFNATAFGNICPQSSGGAEDCLSLNIWTGTTSMLALRPVMFWYRSLDDR